MEWNTLYYVNYSVLIHPNVSTFFFFFFWNQPLRKKSNLRVIFVRMDIFDLGAWLNSLMEWSNSQRAATCQTVQYISTFFKLEEGNAQRGTKLTQFLLWWKSAGITSPAFTVEMMAAVIDRVQSRSCVSSRKKKKHSGIFLSFCGGAGRGGAPETTVSVYSVSTITVNAFWGRVEWYFQWLHVASTRKCVIFVTIPPENKVYLSVKRQRFTIIQMST